MGEIQVDEATQAHLDQIRVAADGFLEAIKAAAAADVSQALILPMLLEQLRDSGVELSPAALMGSLG